MRGAALGRLTARLLVIVVTIVGAGAVGVALVILQAPKDARKDVPAELPAAGAVTTPESGFIVLSNLPTPTHTPTRPPLPTATVFVPSPTPTATPTATPTLTPTATLTWTPPPTDTATPRPTSTPIVPTRTPPNPPPPTPVSFAAPALISPESGATYYEDDTIELMWQPVGALPPGVFYVITLAYPHEGATWYDETPWTQETSWRMSEHRYLLDLADGGHFTWSVQVRRRTGVGADGRPTGVPLGPESEVRTLTWRRPSGGGGGGRPNTPEPPPP